MRGFHSDLKKIEEEEKLLIVEIIKKYVDWTVAGRPQFRISTIVQELQKNGYEITGQRISRFINSTKIDGKKIFQKTDNAKARYTCDKDLFNSLYDELKRTYGLIFGR